jgi:hypothetical protein
MKLTKSAAGKTKLKISREEWEKIGNEKGWMKEAKWGKEDVVDPKEKGKWKGYSQEELRSKLNKAKERNKKRRDKGEKANPKDTELIRELQFALRSKKGWGKVD